MTHLRSAEAALRESVVRYSEELEQLFAADAASDRSNADES